MKKVKVRDLRDSTDELKILIIQEERILSLEFREIDSLIPSTVSFLKPSSKVNGQCWEIDFGNLLPIIPKEFIT